MFVLVTLLSVWLAWETSVVRERQMLLREIRRGDAFHATPANVWAERFQGNRPGPQPLARIPIVRIWLGDEAIQVIRFNRGLTGFSEPLLSRLERAFPEAEFDESFSRDIFIGRAN
ncbi:MAG: hypothetical protein HYS13_16950 [Planctomycetia bacterium]|nr:hypothetical protein [Planctomycetia bacterium]